VHPKVFNADPEDMDEDLIEEGVAACAWLLWRRKVSARPRSFFGFGDWCPPMLLRQRALDVMQENSRIVVSLRHRSLCHLPSKPEVFSIVLF